LNVANDVDVPRYNHPCWSLPTDWYANAFPGWQVSDCLLDHLPDDMEDNVGPPQLDIASAVTAVTANASTSPQEVCSADVMCGRNPLRPAVASRQVLREAIKLIFASAAAALHTPTPLNTASRNNSSQTAFQSIACALS